MLLYTTFSGFKVVMGGYGTVWLVGLYGRHDFSSTDTHLQYLFSSVQFVTLCKDKPD